jgi:hypothetical protein
MYQFYRAYRFSVASGFTVAIIVHVGNPESRQIETCDSITASSEYERKYIRARHRWICSLSMHECYY